MKPKPLKKMPPIQSKKIECQECKKVIDINEKHTYKDCFEYKNKMRFTTADFFKEICKLKDEEKRRQVEWLKKKYKYEWKNSNPLSPLEFNNLVDNAFPDVVKK